jgi:hypothetical protein
MEVEPQYNMTETISQIKQNIMNGSDCTELIRIVENDIKHNPIQVNSAVYVFILLLNNDIREIFNIKSMIKVRILLIRILWPLINILIL